MRSSVLIGLVQAVERGGPHVACQGERMQRPCGNLAHDEVDFLVMGHTRSLCESDEVRPVRAL